MLTEICNYLKNWFDFEQPKFYGKFKIENGILTSINDGDMGIITGQYFRIIGSVLNDGVYSLADELEDEEFVGAVWLMAVPKDVKSVANDIKAWQEKYGGVDSINLSPFQSESFGGYSYSKGGSSNTSSSSVPTWQSIFADRLARYKKI